MDFKNFPCDCNDSKFQPIGFASTTLMYYVPSYDRDGNNLNPDGNTTTQQFRCSGCGKVATASTRYGLTTFYEH